MKTPVKSSSGKRKSLVAGSPCDTRLNSPSVSGVLKFRQELFWDVNPKIIDPKRHARYIIERILDFGNDVEIRWMVGYYPHALIADVVKHSRVLHAPTRSLWKLLIKAI